MLLPEYIVHKALLTSLDKTDAEFALALYKDSNAVASKTQVHSSLHNTTSFKYRVPISKKCRFNLSRPCIIKTRMTGLDFIEISRNHLWINP